MVELRGFFLAVGQPSTLVQRGLGARGIGSHCGCDNDTRVHCSAANNHRKGSHNVYIRCI
jgi:hypothetical protein